ncbi:hypothetical protein [Thermoanaerobacter uzonensis]|uniref:hypothetical protein n=1 Tax=Thermoanaerobacter uzonensis TaxID=447593 RepID=UPI003D769473
MQKVKKLAWARYRVVESAAGEYPPLNCGGIVFRYFRLIGISADRWTWGCYGYKNDDGNKYDLTTYDIKKCPNDAVPLDFHDVEIYCHNPVEYTRAKPEWVVTDISKFVEFIASA